MPIQGPWSESSCASVTFPQEVVGWRLTGPMYSSTSPISVTRQSETRVQIYWNLLHTFKINGCLEFGEWWVC